MTNLRVTLFFLLLGTTTLAWSHSAERGLVMLLPTNYYALGASLAVALSFIILILIPSSWLEHQTSKQRLIFSVEKIPATCLSCISFIFLVALVVIGVIGSQDPLRNPLPLFIWAIWWFGLTTLQFFLGNIWQWINPWVGPTKVLQNRFKFAHHFYSLPKKWGYGMALFQFGLFSWFELIDLAPENPTRLAMVVSFYWLFNFLGVLVFGCKDWLGKAEPFSIFFSLIGKCSFLNWQNCEEQMNKTSAFICWPGSQFSQQNALPLSGILFVILTLSSVSFDGLSKTFLWLGAFGINPLDFQGRSSVQIINSFGLVSFFILLSLLYLCCSWMGIKLALRQSYTLFPIGFFSVCGRWVYSIMPIALVFHIAHYFTLFLVNSQYALLSFNDPLGLGWNWLGFRHSYVTTSFLSNLTSVGIIWKFQTFIIVWGHIIGIMVAHRISLQLFKSDTTQAILARNAQFFLAALMVAYTAFGLWLLSSASIG